jgi:hypothetical protein
MVNRRVDSGETIEESGIGINQWRGYYERVVGAINRRREIASVACMPLMKRGLAAAASRAIEWQYSVMKSKERHAGNKAVNKHNRMLDYN